MSTKVERIVVGVDGSANSRRALEWAVTVAGRFGAEVVAVHAVGLLSHLGGGPPVPSHGHLDELRQLFENEWCAPLAGCDVPHRMVTLDGPPVLVLLDAASREDADLIVVGSRGAGGFAELRLGSTSHQVVQHSTRPVLVVPPPAVPG